MAMNPVGIIFALTNLTVSNLVAWAWRSYVRSLGPLTVNIITYLNMALLQVGCPTNFRFTCSEKNIKTPKQKLLFCPHVVCKNRRKQAILK